MRIGEYRIMIENMDGELLAEVERTGATGHPGIGEEIVLDGLVYVVERVRHEDEPDGGRTRRRYTWPRLFVRRRDGLVRGRRKEPQRAAPPNVLPFSGGRRPRGGVEAVILPPALVAILVACGYEEQARQCARLARGGARLLETRQGWFVEAGQSPAEALQRLREAREARRRIGRWLTAMSAAATRWQRQADESLAEWLRERQLADDERARRERDERRASWGLLSDGAAAAWRACAARALATLRPRLAAVA